MIAIIFSLCIAAVVAALVRNFGQISEQEKLESLSRWIEDHGGKWFLNQDEELKQLDEHEEKISK